MLNAETFYLLRVCGGGGGGGEWGAREEFEFENNYIIL